MNSIARPARKSELSLTHSPVDPAAVGAWWRLLNETGDVFYVHDLDGRLLAVNPAFYRATGYTEADLPRLNISDLLTPEDFAANGARIASFLAGGELQFPVEMAIRRKDGSLSYAEFVPAVIDGQDGLPLIVGVARDVSARTMADAELREAAAFQATLAEVSLALHAAQTLDELCLLICSQGRRLLGVSAARLFLVRETGLVPVASEGATAFLSQEHYPLDRGGSLVITLRTGTTMAVDSNGEPNVPPTVLLLPLNGRRGPLGVLALHEPHTPGCLDDRLSQRAEILAMQAAVAVENAQLIEELRRADRLKSDFLASVSHDLRTPLNVIIGYTDLQIEGVLGPVTAEQLDALRRMRSTSLSLAALINATLDLNRLEAGRSLIESVPVSLDQLWAELLLEFEEYPDWGQVPLRWQADAVPGFCSDPEKLKLIVRNLVSNALKFTRAGTITITIGYDAAARRLELTVADSGPGIAAEDLPQIFGMFRQGAHARGGVGLGLYLVKRVVELLGGEINVTSRIGVGSTFRVALPADPAR
ncbi:MAG: PAS domain S-box protein [Deltaproteobacteria bacterium]|nr:PAS domain S-box protein [Deltaproteobacteria bacterium]MBI3388422.1 PAS domain S-box protein [Deltaproteobacteria bacterium]